MVHHSKNNCRKPQHMICFTLLTNTWLTQLIICTVILSCQRIFHIHALMSTYTDLTLITPPTRHLTHCLMHDLNYQYSLQQLDQCRMCMSECDIITDVMNHLLLDHDSVYQFYYWSLIYIVKTLFHLTPTWSNVQLSRPRVSFHFPTCFIP